MVKANHPKWIKQPRWKPTWMLRWLPVRAPLRIQRLAWGSSWETGKRAERDQWAKQEVSALLHMTSAWLPGKESESTWADPTELPRSLQPPSTSGNWWDSQGLWGLRRGIAAYRYRPERWVQRGGGLGVSPRVPRNWESAICLLSYPPLCFPWTPLPSVLFGVMKMYLNWVVVMVMVTQLNKFARDHQI